MTNTIRCQSDCWETEAQTLESRKRLDTIQEVEQETQINRALSKTL